MDKILEMLDKQCEDIMSKALKEINILRSNFALETCEYGIGDIIEDHFHIIKVEDIRVYNINTLECVYMGIQLKKDLTPYKIQAETAMYSNNVERKIEER